MNSIRKSRVDRDDLTLTRIVLCAHSWKPGLVVGLLLLLGPVSGVLFAAEPLNLPAWFWQPPQAGDAPVAVGYARPYRYPASSYEEAFDDAARRLWQDRSCTIRAAKASMKTGPEVLSLGSIAQIEADTSGFAVFQANLVRLDSCWTDRLVLMLVGSKDIPELKRDRMPSPDHETDTATDPDFLKATGIASTYRFLTTSWLEAERWARRNLALYVQSTVKSYAVTHNQQNIATQTIESVIAFRDIKTLLRTYDPQMGECRVVVGVKPEDAVYQESDE